MYSFGLVCLALCALAPMLAEGASYAETTGHLNLTAIAAHDGRSSLECWQLTDSLISAPGPGGIAKTLMTELGPAGNVSWTVAPARTDLGLHNAASVLCVLRLSFLTGSALPYLLLASQRRCRDSWTFLICQILRLHLWSCAHTYPKLNSRGLGFRRQERRDPCNGCGQRQQARS